MCIIPATEYVYQITNGRRTVTIPHVRNTVFTCTGYRRKLHPPAWNCNKNKLENLNISYCCSCKGNTCVLLIKQPRFKHSPGKLCCFLGKDTLLTQSTQVYKMVPPNSCNGLAMNLIPIPLKSCTKDSTSWPSDLTYV